MKIKTGDRFFEERKRFEVLPDGYTIRRGRVLTSSKTSRKMTEAGNAALYEIASAAPCWTEWGEGHATSMWSGACERRGYIEVAAPEKPSQGRMLFRATRSGVLLANEWRKLRGEEPLPVPPLKLTRILPPGDRPSEREWVRAEGARGDEWPENLGTWELHDAILAEPDTDRVRMLNAELQARLDSAARVAVERV